MTSQDSPCVYLLGQPFAREEVEIASRDDIAGTPKFIDDTYKKSLILGFLKIMVPASALALLVMSIGYIVSPDAQWPWRLIVSAAVMYGLLVATMSLILYQNIRKLDTVSPAQYPSFSHSWTLGYICFVTLLLLPMAFVSLPIAWSASVWIGILRTVMTVIELIAGYVLLPQELRYVHEATRERAYDNPTPLQRVFRGALKLHYVIAVLLAGYALFSGMGNEFGSGNQPPALYAAGLFLLSGIASTLSTPLLFVAAAKMQLHWRAARTPELQIPLREGAPRPHRAATEA